MELPKDKKIIFFDGVCNLCNGAVQYVIERDKKDVFRYASLQSDVGQRFLKERNLNAEEFDSIILYEPGKQFLHKSKAAFAIIKEFGGLWPLFRIFRFLPTSFNDFFYDIVAKNRYRWFGKQESCWIPTPELKAKFLG
ncbi:thiol-disulfide oxidoreductase DCC family protein [Sungkyunkwania multivorans]|uniref:Thiol-disulfide oxidoreductase DCC family protein n=1 Tax=Sungkyunkwania multivorans TaxID=1173618 RepID=A0ABW3CWU8_9FLAO